ncbi:unnamed protein product [Cylindrotheca closterium]|uniref:Uncharacterized protein n=1 Tax=Cylindrotheca closterium TaxID=2856 RepID=A0AAD2GBI4_9STRA|nr:unnamed protein product [Cylindrotheca closterium]
MAPLLCQTAPCNNTFDKLYLPAIDSNKQLTDIKPKKNVSFAYCVQAVEVPSVSEMTKQEYRSTFYCSKDYRQIERENGEILQQMERQQKVEVETESLYFRGLEVQLPRAMQERSRLRRFVVSEVLREQGRYGRIRKEWVENFSSRFTSQNAAAAQRRGAWDMRATAKDSDDSSCSQ